MAGALERRPPTTAKYTCRPPATFIASAKRVTTPASLPNPPPKSGRPQGQPNHCKSFLQKFYFAPAKAFHSALARSTPTVSLSKSKTPNLSNGPATFLQPLALNPP